MSTTSTTNVSSQQCSSMQASPINENEDRAITTSNAATRLIVDEKDMLPQNQNPIACTSSHSTASEAKGEDPPLIVEGSDRTAIQNHSPKMDKSDLKALKEATRAQEHGDSIISTFKDPAKYQPYMESLMRSLAKRESVLGRYNHLTALTYVSIGNAYKQLQESRSVAMFRTHYRIETILYGKTNGHIAGSLKEILNSRGLSPDELADIREDVLLSAKYELQGDIFRRLGERKNAVQSYQKAARVEEVSFGRDNADLAYLWRKIACLAAINKPIGSAIDFDEADRMGNRWMRQAKDHLSISICALIRKGDHFYSTLLYNHAVGEYSKASRVLTNKSCQKKTKTSASTKSSNKKNKEETDVSKEIETLLNSGEQQHSKLTNADSDSAPPSPFSTRPPKVAGSEFSGYSTSSHSLDTTSSFAADLCIVEEEDEMNQDEEISSKDDDRDILQNRSSSSLKKQPKSAATKKKKESQAQKEDYSKSGVSQSTLASSASRKTHKELKPSKKSSMGSSTENPKKQVRRRPASSSSLHPSMPPKEHEGGKPNKQRKPKSDSYLSKIGKVASKTTKMAKKQIKRGANSIRELSLASFHGDHSIDGSNHNVLQEQINYNKMASPPPTPFLTTPEMEAQRKLKKHSKKKTKTAYEEKESLDKFLMQGNSSESSDMTKAVDNRSISDQSIISTDEEIRQRFLQTSSQISDRIEWSNFSLTKKKKLKGKKSQRKFGSEEGEIPLIDLARDVQLMSSLLQRQTLRLQNTVEDFPVEVPDKHLRKKLSRNDPPSKESRDLSEDVQRLIQECEATINLAFRQLDNPKCQKSKHNVALQEYRKTFTLEKAFLDELKKQLTTLLPSSNSTTLGHPSDEDSGELQASFNQIASASFGLLNDSNSSETVGDESILSIVFSPSGRSKRQVQSSDVNRSIGKLSSKSLRAAAATSSISDHHNFAQFEP